MATCPTCKTRYAEDAKICPVDGEALLPDEAFSNVEPELVAGQRVGEYEIESKLGEGGFGSVYRAVHPLIGKAAAIKVLNRQYSSNPQMVSRFIAEARAVNQIRNRNIIDIFSFGRLEDGRQYYVMELLEGLTFDKYLRERGRLAPEEAIPILRGIARALEAAHAAGIAHRDLKPENIYLVIEEDGVVFPKLLDFGIAKLLGDSMMGHKTRTGTPMGTPHYMSPEQCRGKNVDHRTDIYSFGILTHEALTGQLPFNGEDVMDILFKQTSAAAPRMSEVCPALPAALDGPVLHMLEKDPANRPASTSVAIEELAAVARDAGFDVKVVVPRAARKSGDGGTPILPNTAKALTPAQMGALAEARTLVQEEPGKTLMASETEVKPARRGRALLYVGAVFALALVSAVGIVVSRSSEPGSSGVAAAKPSSNLDIKIKFTAGDQEPSIRINGQDVSSDKRSTPPAPSAAPSSSAEAEPQTGDVELTFDATPKSVDVYLEGKKIGTTPGPIKVKRSDEPLKLTFKANGFKPAEKEVSAAKSDSVSIQLTHATAAPPSTKTGHRELEF